MRIILSVKSIINLIIGILIIVLRESILNYLSFVIAGALLIESIEDLIYVIVKKTYLEKKDALFSPLAITIIGIVLIVENILSPTPESNIEFVCIIWGTVSIYAACKDIDAGIHEYKNKKKLFIHIGEGLIALVFAFLLMLNPLEHVIFHLVVLGIEFILESLVLGLHCIRYKVPTHIHLDQKAIDEIEKLHAYIEENPTKEEEIINSLKNR